MLSKLSSKVLSTAFQTTSRYLSTKGLISYSVVEAESSDEAVPVVLAHGALGNKKNFNTLAKRLSNELNRSVITYDARNHGKSKRTEEMSLEAMSEDLEDLLKELGEEKCILIGHSLGGRTSMYTALHKPELIHDLIVVDVPVKFDMGRRCSLIRFLEAMKQIDLESFNGGSIAKARLSADRQLKPSIRDEVIRQFILTNIEKDEEGVVHWRVNLDALLTLLKDPDSNVVTPQSTPFNNRCLFLCGGASNYVTDNDVDAIKESFPNAIISHIPDCGHWVHFEKPNEFLHSVKQYLQPHTDKLMEMN